MDTEIVPHTMYFSDNCNTTTKINHVPHQTIDYDDKGMFSAQLMDETPIQAFIDNGVTHFILPLHSLDKYPVLQTYPNTESHISIYTGGGMIDSHFWIKIPLKLDNQLIQMKVLVCDLECP